MTTFDDKEKAAENKYAYDKEMEFRIHARAHKLVGLWAAARMGLTGESAEEYAKSIVMIDLNKPDPHHLFEKIKADLTLSDVHISDHDIRAEIHKIQHIAHQQVVGE